MRWYLHLCPLLSSRRLRQQGLVPPPLSDLPGAWVFGPEYATMLIFLDLYDLHHDAISPIGECSGVCPTCIHFVAIWSPRSHCMLPSGLVLFPLPPNSFVQYGRSANSPFPSRPVWSACPAPGSSELMRVIPSRSRLSGLRGLAQNRPEPRATLQHCRPPKSRSPPATSAFATTASASTSTWDRGLSSQTCC